MLNGGAVPDQHAEEFLHGRSTEDVVNYHFCRSEQHGVGLSAGAFGYKDQGLVDGVGIASLKGSAGIIAIDQSNDDVAGFKET